MYVSLRYVYVCLGMYVCVCVCLICVGMCVSRCTFEGRGQLKRVGFFYYVWPQGSTHLQNICQALWLWVIWVLGEINSCLLDGSLISFSRQYFLIEQCWLANVLQAFACLHLPSLRWEPVHHHAQLLNCHWECRLRSFCFRSRYFLSTELSPHLYKLFYLK